MNLILSKCSLSLRKKKEVLRISVNTFRTIPNFIMPAVNILVLVSDLRLII